MPSTKRKPAATRKPSAAKPDANDPQAPDASSSRPFDYSWTFIHPPKPGPTRVFHVLYCSSEGVIRQGRGLTLEEVITTEAKNFPDLAGSPFDYTIFGASPPGADVVLAIVHCHGDPAGSYHVTRFVNQHAEASD